MTVQQIIFDQISTAGARFGINVASVNTNTTFQIVSSSDDVNLSITINETGAYALDLFWCVASQNANTTSGLKMDIQGGTAIGTIVGGFMGFINNTFTN